MKGSISESGHLGYSPMKRNISELGHLGYILMKTNISVSGRLHSNEAKHICVG